MNLVNHLPGVKSILCINTMQLIYSCIIGQQDVQELQKAFAEAVDDYLDTCRRIGKDPPKTYKGSFNVRIKSELHQKASLLAQSQGVSLNQLIADAIEHYIH